MRRFLSTLVVGLSLAGLAAAQALTSETSDKGPFGPAQSAADMVREATGPEIALLPAGILYREFEGDDLSKLIKYPSETLHVSKLTGDQLFQALNRSVSLYPSPNSGFLQISGLEVTFDPKKPASERVGKVVVDGRTLDRKAEYLVAMPVSLARGGYGYFNVWDKTAIVQNFENLTLESVLKGKRPDVQAPRWKTTG